MKEGEVVEVEHGRGGDQNHESRASSETVPRQQAVTMGRAVPASPQTERPRAHSPQPHTELSLQDDPADPNFFLSFHLFKRKGKFQYAKLL